MPQIPLQLLVKGFVRTDLREVDEQKLGGFATVRRSIGYQILLAVELKFVNAYSGKIAHLEFANLRRCAYQFYLVLNR